MSCPKCHQPEGRPLPGCAHDCHTNPKPLVIEQPGQVVLFHTMVVPAAVADDSVTPPENGAYRNMLVHYEATQNTWLYSSDGIPTLLTPNATRDFNLLQNRPKYADQPMTSLTNIPSVEAVMDRTTVLEDGLAQEILERTDADRRFSEAIDENVVTSVNTIEGESTVTLSEASKNLLNGNTAERGVALPVASPEHAGVMNTATYEALMNDIEVTNAILNGAYALDGLPENVTQEQLTEAWNKASGSEQPMNRASIYDVDNQRTWYYYTNVGEWFTNRTEGPIVSNWTNNAPGLVQGSTLDGQIFAEGNGTGSVNGWDKILARLDSLENKDYGIPKLYGETGDNTDGAMTQKAVSDLIKGLNDTITKLTNRITVLENTQLKLITTAEDPGEGAAQDPYTLVGVYIPGIDE